ncbi:MAG: hypothetical protein PVI30_17005, partial [Myxococcales bacterium]
MAETDADRKSRTDRQADAARRLAARRAAKAAAKASKRGTDAVPDVTETVEVAQGWYEQNSRTLWAAVVGGGLIAVIWLAISAHMDKTASEGASELAEAVETANAPIIAEGETPPEGVDESYSSVETRAEKAAAAFEQVQQDHPDTDAARWAKLGEANELYALGKYDEAVKAFDAVLAQAQGNAFLEWRALEGSGFALEAQEKYAQAQKRFEELSAVQSGAY